MMKAAMAAAAERIKVSREAEEKLEAESAGKSNEVADLRRRLAEMEGKLHLLEHLEEDNRALRSRLEEARAAAEDAVRGEAGAREAARASVKRAEDLEAKLSMAVTDTRTLEAQHNAKMEELEAMRAELQEQISAAEEVGALLSLPAVQAEVVEEFCTRAKG